MFHNNYCQHFINAQYKKTTCIKVLLPTVNPKLHKLPNVQVSDTTKD